MPAGEDEFELAGSRLAEQRDRTRSKTARARVVMLHLLQYARRIFLGVQIPENLANQFLLVAGELFDARFGDEPIVVDLRLQFVPEWKTNRLTLRFAQGFVEFSHQRLGSLLRLRKFIGGFNNRTERQQCGGGSGGLQETA